MEQFDVVRAVFRPKNLATLRKEAKQYIGLEADWCASWMVDAEDGGPYVGQWAFTLAGDIRLPLGWVPEEDLELVSKEQ